MFERRIFSNRVTARSFSFIFIVARRSLLFRDRRLDSKTREFKGNLLLQRSGSTIHSIRTINRCGRHVAGNSRGLIVYTMQIEYSLNDSLDPTDLEIGYER